MKKSLLLSLVIARLQLPNILTQILLLTLYLLLFLSLSLFCGDAAIFVIVRAAAKEIIGFLK